MSTLPTAPEILEELKHKQVATLYIAGVTPHAISKELGISRRQVAKIMQSEEFRGYLKESAESMITTTTNAWKAAMEPRLSEALRVLDHHFKSNNLRAVELYLKSIGIEHQEPVQQSPNLTVVLPSLEQQPKPVDIEVSSGKKDYQN